MKSLDWYDGQTWTKPSEFSLNNCHLQVQPILQLQRTLGLLALLLLSRSLEFFVSRQ